MKKCPVETCRVKTQHFHEQSAFRSRITPWWKKNQNPRIGEDWKNPVKK
ncbi:MAG: hypothetical protein AB8B61_02940 [Cyclobacteriaceae bacterium]